MARRGFSLGELVIALGIFALPILFVIGLYTTNFALQSKTEGLLETAHVAESLLEEWKARPYSELSAISGAPASLTTRTFANVDYLCEFQVSPLQPASLNPGGVVLQLEARVTKTQKSGIGDSGTRTEQVQETVLRSAVSPGASL